MTIGSGDLHFRLTLNTRFVKEPKKIGLTPDELRLDFAVYLFSLEKLTLGQASKIAGMHQMEFQKELAKRKIPIHYNEDDLERDLQTISNHCKTKKLDYLSKSALG